jgi:hypothetical protein
LQATDAWTLDKLRVSKKLSRLHICKNKKIRDGLHTECAPQQSDWLVDHIDGFCIEDIRYIANAVGMSAAISALAWAKRSPDIWPISLSAIMFIVDKPAA